MKLYKIILHKLLFDEIWLVDEDGIAQTITKIEK